MATTQLMSATASDYAELLKKKEKDIEGVSMWEKAFLQPLQESYKASEQNIKSGAAYDISGAYANYKKQAAETLQNQYLGTGYKEQITQGLESEYGSAYAGVKSTEASNLSSLASSYSEVIGEEEKSLLKSGQQLVDIEQAVYDYAGVTDEQKKSYFTTDTSGVTKLTDEGKLFFDKAFNAITVDENTKESSSFGTYLQETNPELFDYYYQNRGVINELVGGLNKYDTSYSAEDIGALTDIQTKNTIIKSALDIFGNESAVTQYDTTPVMSLKTRKNSAGNIVTSGDNKIIIKDVEYDIKDVISSDVSNELMSKFSNANVGDVVFYNGKLYLYNSLSKNKDDGGRATARSIWYELGKK